MHAVDLTRPISILVADDDYGHRRMLEIVLASYAFEVTGAQDGKEALEYLAQNKPDVMLLDVDMPHATGFEICDQARSEPRLKDVPVIIMTGKAPEQVEARAERSQPNALLFKPISSGKLRSLIDDLVGKRD